MQTYVRYILWMLMETLCFIFFITIVMNGKYVFLITILLMNKRFIQTTSSKRILTNKNNANDYSSIESQNGQEGSKKGERETNQAISRNICSSDNTATTDKCFESNEVESKKESNRDDHLGDSIVVSTITNIDETNNTVDQHAEEETIKDVDADTQVADMIDLNGGNTNKDVDIHTDETFEKRSSEGERGNLDEVCVNVGVADDEDDKLLDQSSDVSPKPHDSSTDDEIIIKPSVNGKNGKRYID